MILVIVRSLPSVHAAALERLLTLELFSGQKWLWGGDDDRVLY